MSPKPTNTTNSADVALAKARATTASVKQSTDKVNATKEDYQQIPGFSKYEINSKGIVRSMATGIVQEKAHNGKFRIYNDKGERPRLTSEELLELLPKKVEPVEVKKEVVKQTKATNFQITPELVNIVKSMDEVKSILALDVYMHVKHYKIYLLGIDVSIIAEITSTPLPSRKRNIWYYTSGKKTIS